MNLSNSKACTGTGSERLFGSIIIIHSFQDTADQKAKLQLNVIEHSERTQRTNGSGRPSMVAVVVLVDELIK